MTFTTQTSISLFQRAFTLNRLARVLCTAPLCSSLNNQTYKVMMPFDTGEYRDTYKYSKLSGKDYGNGIPRM